MRSDLRNIKKNATWLRDNRERVICVRLNDAWRDVICELCDEIDQLEAKIEDLRRLAYDYIQAYEKLAFEDALLTGDCDG